MGNTTFNSKKGARPITYLRVWTFHFLFSREYVESVLARYGVEYHFQSLPPGTRKQTFLKLVKIEDDSHHTRVHQWEFVEDSESSLPESYRWGDISSRGMRECHIWQYNFAYDSFFGVPMCSMHVVLGWKNHEQTRRVYRCLKWVIKSSSEEVLFEVPLNLARLGKKWGSWDDVKVGDRQIFYEEEDPRDRNWECKSSKDTDIDWWWWLRLQIVASSGRLRRF